MQAVLLCDLAYKSRVGAGGSVFDGDDDETGGVQVAVSKGDGVNVSEAGSTQDVLLQREQRADDDCDAVGVQYGR